ncbi:MAG: hypothetical protein ACK4E3_03575 [Brevundimonas sp.]|uniref:hypothetical protein n=1 Tax=Brevundimonas sp. TaxID=1871086 RepID=UPI00391D8460
MKVKTPKGTEDPEARAARQREQARVDAAVLETTQENLDDETRRRLRRLGRRQALAGVSPGRPGLGGGGSGGGFIPIGGGVGGGGSGGIGGGDAVIRGLV